MTPECYTGVIVDTFTCVLFSFFVTGHHSEGSQNNPRGWSGGTGRLGEIKVGSTVPEGGRAPMHRPYLLPSQASRTPPVGFQTRVQLDWQMVRLRAGGQLFWGSLRLGLGPISRPGYSLVRPEKGEVPRAVTKCP